MKSFDRALAISPNNAEALSAKGLGYQNLGHHQDAVSCFTKSLAVDPRSEITWLRKASSLCSLERIEEAIACYDKALEINPRNIDARAKREKIIDKKGTEGITSVGISSLKHEGQRLLNCGHPDEALKWYD